MSTTHREGTHYADAVTEAIHQMAHVEEISSWPLSERLKAFFFMLLDAVEARAMDAEPNAPATAFRRDASGWFSPFQEALREVLPTVGDTSAVHGVNQWLASLAPNRVVIAEVIVQLIQTSLMDTSEERQRSAALADRVLTVLASTWSTPIPAQIVDVLRYSVEAGYVPIDRWPVFRQWFDNSTAPFEERSPSHDGENRDESRDTADAG